MDGAPTSWPKRRAGCMKLLAEESADQAATNPTSFPRAGCANCHMPRWYRIYRFHGAPAARTEYGPRDPLRGSPVCRPTAAHSVGYNGRHPSFLFRPDIHRPNATRPPDCDVPSFCPSKRWISKLRMGACRHVWWNWHPPITVRSGECDDFGYVLLNDWSAPTSGWEYSRLPVQGKAFRHVESLRDRPLRRHLIPSATRTSAVKRKLLAVISNSTNRTAVRHRAEGFDQPEGAANGQRSVENQLDADYYSAAEQLCHHPAAARQNLLVDAAGSGTISGQMNPNRCPDGADAGRA